MTPEMENVKNETLGPDEYINMILKEPESNLLNKEPVLIVEIQELHQKTNPDFD